jgi:hypothetical protein
MEIFIKAFNRAFCLERCLRTIERFVSGASRITVLDDGTPARYLDRIQKLFPGVQIVQSPHGELKIRLVADGTYDEKLPDSELAKIGLVNPAAFWCSEIAKCGSSYVCVLEEDVWFVRAIALDMVESNLVTNGALLFNMSRNAVLAGWGKVLAVRRVPIDANVTLEYYTPRIVTALDWFQLFTPSQAVYKTDYYTNAFSSPDYNFTTRSQFDRSLEYLKRMTKPAAFAFAAERLVANGLSTTSRKNTFTGRVFDPYPFNRAMNEAWLSGQLDSNADLPLDFSEGRLLAALESHMTREQALEWKTWKDGFFAYYRNMGVAGAVPEEGV